MPEKTSEKPQSELLEGQLATALEAKDELQAQFDRVYRENLTLKSEIERLRRVVQLLPDAIADLTKWADLLGTLTKNGKK